MITFRVDKNSGFPVYRQIEDQIRMGIASGLLKPEDKLPTVRWLAVELTVNPNTVIKAYSNLERDGLLRTEQGKGTFITPTPPAAPAEPDREAKLYSLCGEFLAQAARFGFSPAEVVRAIQAMNPGGSS
jgi:GntR family transcriptional regulator